MKSKTLAKMLMTIIMAILATTIFSVSVYAYYQLLVSNKNNIIKSTYYAVDLTLYEEINDSTYNGLSIEEQKEIKQYNNDSTIIYLKKINKLSGVDAYDFIINPCGKSLYLEVENNANTNIDKEYSVIISQNGATEYLLNESVFDKTKSSIVKIYANDDTNSSEINVLTYGNYAIDVNTIKQYIVKGKQTITSPVASSVSSTSITLSEIVSGHGATKYGYSESSTLEPSSWQETTTFNTDLNAGTTYYFYAKYEGDENFEEVISAPNPIKTNYTISTDLTNASADSENLAEISSNGSVTLVFNAESSYLLPIDIINTDVISLSNATLDSWTLSNEGSTGTLILSNPTSNVLITIVAGNKPTIIDQPANNTYPINGNAVVQVTADGSNNSYQWYQSDTNTSWTIINGATNISYNVPSSNAGTWYFKCVVTNQYGSTESNNAEISIVNPV